MKQFIVLKSFKGSTTGANCIDFTKDDPVTDEQLGEDLTAVAKNEKWIKAVKASKTEADIEAEKAAAEKVAAEAEAKKAEK